MRTVLLLTALISVSCTVASGPDDALGVWRVRPDRSPGPYSNVLTIRFEPHNSGEVFTLDWTEANGRSTTSSVLLYFDGRGRTSVLDRRRNAQSGRSVALPFRCPLAEYKVRTISTEQRKVARFGGQEHETDTHHALACNSPCNRNSLLCGTRSGPNCRRGDGQP